MQNINLRLFTKDVFLFLIHFELILLKNFQKFLNFIIYNSIAMKQNLMLSSYSLKNYKEMHQKKL